jgi:cytochrome c-type biogenesis protein CcmH
MSATTSVGPAPVGRGSWNRQIKRWPTWAVLLGIVVVVLLIGSTRSSGPLTDQDRVDSIAQHIACPTCDGESVYESQSEAAANIRSEVLQLVTQGTYSDAQIIQFIQQNYGTRTQLVPKATGFDAIVWALPVFAGVCAIAGLGVAFRRWKRAADARPSDADRALVEAALREQTDEP